MDSNIFSHFFFVSSITQFELAKHTIAHVSPSSNFHFFVVAKLEHEGCS